MRDPLNTKRTQRQRLVDMVKGNLVRDAAFVAAVNAHVAASAIGAVDAATFGYLNDAVGSPNCSILLGSANLACTLDAPWTAADVGKEIHVQGAGTAGGVLVSRIVSFTSASAVTLADVAISAVTESSTSTGGAAVWGLTIDASIDGSPRTGSDGSVSQSLSCAIITGAVAKPLAEHIGRWYEIPDSTISGRFAGSEGEIQNVPVSSDIAKIGTSLRVSGFCNSPRALVQYASASSVYVYGAGFSMDGFRWKGQRTRRGPWLPAPAFRSAVSTVSNLGAESTVAPESWYAVFACANAGSSECDFKIMPVCRAGSVAGSVITLNKAGEGIHSVIAKTYSWAVNSLVGCDVLIMREGDATSGRVDSVTANSATSVTLSAIGSVAAGDIFCIAPPGYAYYSYVGCFYFDTLEVRNIADTGSIVAAKMITVSDPSFSAAGAVASPTRINIDGYISPFASAVIVQVSSSFVTATTGAYAEYFDHDGATHVVATNYYEKVSTSSETFLSTQLTLPFSVGQRFWYSNAGGVASLRTLGKIDVVGWVE